MVHHSLGTLYLLVTDETQYRNLVESPGNRDEVGGFTSWRNRDWHDPDPIAVGKPYYPTT